MEIHNALNTPFWIFHTLNNIMMKHEACKKSHKQNHLISSENHKICSLLWYNIHFIITILKWEISHNFIKVEVSLFLLQFTFAVTHPLTASRNVCCTGQNAQTALKMQWLFAKALETQTYIKKMWVRLKKQQLVLASLVSFWKGTSSASDELK